MRLIANIDERPPAQVESAAYYAVVHCMTGPSSVTATRCDGVLRVDIETPSTPPDLLAVQDRVGALDGLVSVDTRTAASCRIRVELPCAS
jgi:acetamidase/formamidase